MTKKPSANSPAWLDKGERDANGIPWPDENELGSWLSEASNNMPTQSQWAQLIAGLRHAAGIGGSNHTLEGLSNDATGVALAVETILGFLDAQDITKKHQILGPLIRLQAALIDLSEGKVNALFKPLTRKPGKPGVGIAEAHIIALAARAMSALIDEGKPKQDASREVVAALRANGGKYKNVTAGRVEGWRDRISEGGGGGRIPKHAVEHYRNIIPAGLASSELIRALRDVTRLGL